MDIKIKAILDKIVVDKSNINEIMENIDMQFRKYNYANFEIVSIQEGEKELCGPRLAYKYFDKYNRLDKKGPLYLDISFRFAFLNFDEMKLIYYIYSYLERNIGNDGKLEIVVEFKDRFRSVENSKYKTNVEEVKIIEGNYENGMKLDFIDFLEYIVNMACYSKSDFDKFMKELEIKSKYQHILDNIENYERKIIPVNFKEKMDMKYKEIDIICAYSFDYVSELINAMKQQKGIQVYILDEKEIKYNLINTDFSNTTLRKYILLDEDENLFYVLEEIIGAGDEVCGNLYISSTELPDEQVIANKQIHNDIYNNIDKETYDSDNNYY